MQCKSSFLLFSFVAIYPWQNCNSFYVYLSEIKSCREKEIVVNLLQDSTHFAILYSLVVFSLAQPLFNKSITHICKKKKWHVPTVCLAIVHLLRVCNIGTFLTWLLKRGGPIISCKF
jgi:hypothetical protein